MLMSRLDLARRGLPCCFGRGWACVFNISAAKAHGCLLRLTAGQVGTMRPWAEPPILPCPQIDSHAAGRR